MAAAPARPLVPRWLWAVIAGLVVVVAIVAFATSSGSGFKPAEVAVANVSSIPIYAKPGGSITHTLASPDPTNYNQKQVFLVLADQGAWLQVSLPIPPNGQSGWVKTSQIILTKNDYRVDVSRSAHELRVFDKDKLVKTYPVAIGKSDTPTPGGTYFIRVLIKSTDPAYGPWAYGLSGYSSVLTNFNGGNGVIGMHGTNEPQVIGHDASHGCIRLRNADITNLVTEFHLNLGTPVRILA